MVSLSQVQNGLASYIDTEIIAKLGGWKPWVVGAATGLALSNSATIFNEIKKIPLVSMLGVIDENDMINIDALRDEFLKQARKRPITFDIPVIGAITLNETDVNQIYSYIVGG